MENFKIISKNKIDDLPVTAGVYCFFQKQPPGSGHKTLIYIGKAINIKSRVKNHFFQPSWRDNLFIDRVFKIGFIQTNSEIEAMVLEAGLIKKHQPKFNIAWRDDKNYFYFAVAKNKQELPFVLLTHQIKELKTDYIGPFVEGKALKKTLKFLRKVFPFYTSPKHPKNNCAWCHLGLCPGPKLFENPPSPESLNRIAEYQKNIKKLVLILKGERKNVLKKLRKEMKDFSSAQNYENAARVREKIYALEQVMAHTRVIENQNQQNGGWQKAQKILQKLLETEKPVERIECYDVSNIQGKSATGSMVVFKNGQPDKSQYRKFKIKIGSEPNDIAMLREILERRFKNKQWRYPEIILIDGGKAQLNLGIKAKNRHAASKKIRVISIAKGRQELFIENKNQPVPLKKLPQEIYNLVKHLDDEAHRFAITYHKKLRKKLLLNG